MTWWWSISVVQCSLSARPGQARVMNEEAVVFISSIGGGRLVYSTSVWRGGLAGCPRVHHKHESLFVPYVAP
ncbi:hypothetical protein E2C01_022359 [Portunus trituberculatus]|uniref:Secreted protein n=1 Tax=Portunus trituberculatus TaxID=210409 RepID=A0A5B7E6U5_PORTR|nr:hypothetical protein [Portunus trituberculatus]